MSKNGNCKWRREQWPRVVVDQKISSKKGSKKCSGCRVGVAWRCKGGRLSRAAGLLFERNMCFSPNPHQPSPVFAAFPAKTMTAYRIRRELQGRWGEDLREGGTCSEYTTCPHTQHTHHLDTNNGQEPARSEENACRLLTFLLSFHFWHFYAIKYLIIFGSSVCALCGCPFQPILHHLGEGECDEEWARARARSGPVIAFRVSAGE